MATDSIDPMATHPPYAGMIAYSRRTIDGDLSALSIPSFAMEMFKVAGEALRVLKPGKYCAVLMGDTRKHLHYVPISFIVESLFLKVGFLIKEDIIKLQWKAKGTRERWRGKSYDFYKIAHEHLFIAKLFACEKEGLKGDIDHFLVGRLLQAGWHSLSETKTLAIRQALDFAPPIKDRLLDAAKKQHAEFPGIFGDFLVLALCEIGFVSAFLQKEEQTLLDEVLKEGNSKSLYSSVILMWSTRRSLSGEELKSRINSVLGAMSKMPSLPSEEQARMLLLCSSLERQEKTTTGAVKRKLDRLQKKHPSIFKGLLPHARKGFRRPAAKTQH